MRRSEAISAEQSTSSSDTYFIRSDYETNAAVTTMDRLSGGRYWTSERIRSASLFQYHVYRRVAELAKAVDARRLIDVGCGVGIKLQMIKAACPDIEIIGIDQPHAIEFCREHYPFGTWISDDFERPTAGTRPKAADIVVCADVIEHVADPDRLLDYIRSIAGEDSWIFLSTPERDRMRGRDNIRCPHPQHIREWNEAEFSAYVTDRGFTVVETRHLPSHRFSLRPEFLSRDIKRFVQGRPRRNNQMMVLRLGSI